jgi:putative endonuclease
VGEAAAERLLVGRGMRLVERDARLPEGQVDLVMLDGHCLVLVEVKARRTAAYGTPEEAVDHRKLARLRRLALSYWIGHPGLADDVRVDVVAVRIGPDGSAGAAVHIENVLA